MFHFDLFNPQLQRIGKHIVQGLVMLARTDLLEEHSLVEAYMILCYGYTEIAVGSMVGTYR